MTWIAAYQRYEWKLQTENLSLFVISKLYVSKILGHGEVPDISPGDLSLFRKGRFLCQFYYLTFGSTDMQVEIRKLAILQT
jgi:hypothetical protein